MNLFLQGRYYLSAETLFDMKNWVKQIKVALTEIVETEASKSSSKESRVTSTVDQTLFKEQESPFSEPLYASIKEESIHRSNSMSTLPSLCKDQGEAEYLNRSMDECPMFGLSSIDHNHTYSYSSSDDSLNESFAINFNQKMPRSAETSLGRRTAKTKPTISLDYEYQGNNLQNRSPGLYTRPAFKHSTPTKAVDSPDYIKKMYEDMDRVDKQLEMVAKIESDRESSDSRIVSENSSGKDSMNTVVTKHEGAVEVDGENKLTKMEKVMMKMNEESDKLNQMFSKIQNDRTSPTVERAVNSDLYEMVVKYQKTLAEIQSQAMKMILVSL